MLVIIILILFDCPVKIYNCFINKSLLDEVGLVIPANILMKVVLPVPFSPNITTISESVKSPLSIASLNGPKAEYYY